MVETNILLIVARVGVIGEPEDLEMLKAGLVELMDIPLQPHTRVAHTFNKIDNSDHKFTIDRPVMD